MAAEEEEEERGEGGEDEADDEAGDDGEVEMRAVALDVDVARQPAEPRHSEPQDDQQAYDR